MKNREPGAGYKHVRIHNTVIETLYTWEIGRRYVGPMISYESERRGSQHLFRCRVAVDHHLFGTNGICHRG